MDDDEPIRPEPATADELDAFYRDWPVGIGPTDDEIDDMAARMDTAPAPVATPF